MSQHSTHTVSHSQRTDLQAHINIFIYTNIQKPTKKEVDGQLKNIIFCNALRINN